MTKLLLIETSPRGKHSVSRNMTRRFMQDWLAAHPDGEVIERDLVDAGLQFVNAAWLQAYFTPAEQHSPEMANELQLSNELVAELLAVVLIASGGIYTEGSPIQNRDIATQYLRLILGVIGISDVTFVAGGGAKAVDLGEETMERFVEKLGADLERAASV